MEREFEINEHKEDHPIHEHQEHRKEHHTTHEHGSPNKKNDGINKFIVMAVLLGLLIVIAGVQAVELVNIKSQVNSGFLVSASSGSSTNGDVGSTLKNNLQNLPEMVGGC